MKKHLLKSLLALALVLITGNAWGENAAKNTVLWGENFAHFKTNTPSAAGTGMGTTIYGEASITYAQSSTNTKGYDETLAGGTAPELLLSKSDQTWTISGIKTGGAKEMSLSFLSNKTTFSVTCSSSDYIVSGSQKSWTLTLGDCETSPETFNITIKNTGSSNARIDDVELKVIEAGDETPTGPSITCADITINADATSGEIAYTITNPVDGQSVTASTTTDWISDFQYGDGTVTFTTAANTGAEREGTITLSYEGANDKDVTVTQKKATTFTSLEALVAAGAPASDGNEKVTVTLTDEVITKFYTSSSSKRNGVYLQVGEKEIEIYCSNVPSDWIEGGTISGTLENCTWKNYNGTWELCPDNWNELSYSAPQTYTITIDELSNGTIVSSVSNAAAGVEVTLTITPNEHYKLATLTVTDASSDPVTVTDNKFTMPASNVTVSAEFVEKAKYMVIYANTQGFEMVYEGEKADVPVLESLRGWDFAGWTTNLNYTASTTAPTLFDGTVTSDITLMAVYKKTVGGGEVSASLTNVDMTGISNSYATSSVTNEYGVWNYNACRQGNVSSDNEYFLQIRKNNTVSYLQIPEMPGEIISIVLERVCNTSKGQYTGEIYFRTENSNDATAIATATSNEALEDITLNIPTGYKTGYIMSNGACRIYSVTVNYKSGTTTYSLYPSYTVNISSVGFATFYCKKAVTIPEGVTAYYAAYENKTITLNQVQGEVIHQGEGVVLKGDEGSYEFVPTSDVMEDAPNNALFGKEVESEYADLADDGTYVYTLNVGSNGVSFYHMSNTSSLAANRAYLLIPVTDFEDGAGTIGFRFGDATQIENMNAVEAGKYFDLQGREVLTPAGGIYILNGKKVLVK